MLTLVSIPSQHKCTDGGCFSPEQNVLDTKGGEYGMGWQPSPPMLDVTIFMKPECHLCHVIVKMARRVQADIPFTLKPIDISQDETLLIRYGARVPVMLIDQREYLEGHITEGTMRSALKKARWRRPISRILSLLRLGRRRG